MTTSGAAAAWLYDAPFEDTTVWNLLGLESELAGQAASR